MDIMHDIVEQKDVNDSDDEDMTIENYFLQAEGNGEALKLGKKALYRISAFRIAVAYLFAHKHDSESDEERMERLKQKLRVNCCVLFRLDIMLLMEDVILHCIAVIIYSMYWL